MFTTTSPTARDPRLPVASDGPTTKEIAVLPVGVQPLRSPRQPLRTTSVGRLARPLLLCAVIATTAACTAEPSDSAPSDSGPSRSEPSTTTATAGATTDPTPEAAPTTTARPAPPTTQPSAVQTLVTETLRTHLEAGEFVGARISVMTADGTITDGIAGTQTTDQTGAPVALDVPWGVGSVTKSFVAVVVLQLAEEGELDLDAGISEYLPDLAGADQITPRQLLQHTSGLGEYVDDPLVQADAQREWTPGELIAVAEASGRVGEPGGASRYANTNYLVLGEIIEQVTGAPWIDAVQTRIVEPLRMASTGLIGDDAATGYTIVDGTFSDATFGLHPSIGGAAGALQATNHDVLRFATAIADGTLLTPASLAAMRSFVPGEDYSSFGIVHGRGLGLERYENGVVTVLGHLGTGGAHSAFFGFDTAAGTAVVVMMNTANPGPQAVMAIEVLTALATQPAKPTEGP